MNNRTLLLPLIFLLIFPTYAWEVMPKKSISKVKTIETSFEKYSLDFYNSLNDSDLDFQPFETALKGYTKLEATKQLKNSKYLTVIDMSKHSSKKRLFIIDMETKKVITKSFVAHGRNSGFEFAKSFSNKNKSYQSSLGFYKTAETYVGKHGFSLRLDGLEFSNSNARRRAIVMHGADYASENFVKNNGRLGRSLGCPAVPKKEHKKIIETIKNGTCLFIYSPKKYYLQKSKLVNSEIKPLLSSLESIHFD